MKVVIDASVVLSWVLPDERNERAIAAYAAVDEDGAVAPVHFKIEFANALTVAARRGRISLEQRSDAIALADRVGIVFDMDSLETVWTSVPSLADRHRLTVYDALYLDVAMRRGLRLATLDGPLAEAAQRENVRLV